MNTFLKKYVDFYDTFDRGHNKKHMNEVINNAKMLGKKYCPEKIRAVVIGALLHDIGLLIDRKNHEKNGIKIILNDKELCNFIGKDLYDVLDAVGEHRFSNGNPKTIVGKIVYDADRMCNHERAMERAIHYSKEYFPELSENEHTKQCKKHLIDKYSIAINNVFFPETKEMLEKMLNDIKIIKEK